MLRCILLCSFLLLLVQLAHQQATTANEAPLIETTLGRLRGSVMTSRKGRDFYAYRGIYYAKAPTGQRRFAPPEPVEPWNNTLDALADGPSCPQNSRGGEVDEDCLSLNVYTSNVMASNPVIVYIHGGANVYGSANSETQARPHCMLDQDVVLVGVYYRLGAFGFLSTGTPDVYGNIGYLDQILALKWVQQHIASFGGDPNKVTLMGYSSGSYAVTAHLASPLSSGLFHGIVAQSASATVHSELNNVNLTRQLAHELGCPKFGAQYLLNCLRKVEWQDIIDVCNRWEQYEITSLQWNFEIDGHFLLEHPSEAIRSNRFNRVPIMTGTTINEFDFRVQVMFNDVDLLSDIDLNFDLYADELLEFTSTGNDDERAKAIRQFYFNTAGINQNTLTAMGQLRSDCMIGSNVHKLVQLAKNYTNVYYYRFDYTAENSVNPAMLNDVDLLSDIDLNFGLYADELLEFTSTGNDDKRAKAVRQFYFNTAAIDQSSLLAMGQLRSDCQIASNVHTLVQLAKNYTNVYYYRFDYIAENSVNPGVGHAEDRRYTLPTSNNLIGVNSTDNFMVDRMTKLISSFAANGAPPVLDNVTWPPFTAKDPVVMYIDRDLYTGGPYNVERYALWDRLFPLEESSAEVQVPPKESSAEVQVPPKESSAEIQFPAIVVLLFAAAWHFFP